MKREMERALRDARAEPSLKRRACEVRQRPSRRRAATIRPDVDRADERAGGAA